MKQWSDADRGGSGLNSLGKALCRDRYGYQRLRAFFSREFLIDHWYVPERDRPLPHETRRTKPCKACGTVRTNDFRSFPKEIHGDKKLGRHTTADVCRECMNYAMHLRRSEVVEARRTGAAVYEAEGQEMWEPKPT